MYHVCKPDTVLGDKCNSISWHTYYSSTDKNSAYLVARSLSFHSRQSYFVTFIDDELPFPCDKLLCFYL